MQPAALKLLQTFSDVYQPTTTAAAAIGRAAYEQSMRRLTELVCLGAK
jgi:hypothetical protein